MAYHRDASESSMESASNTGECSSQIVFFNNEARTTKMVGIAGERFASSCSEGGLGEATMTEYHSTSFSSCSNSDPITTMPGYVTISGRAACNELEAVFRVFNTAEIRKMILDYLDDRGLLQASEVCKGFNEEIDGCPDMQRCLLRLPDLPLYRRRLQIRVKGLKIACRNGALWVLANLFHIDPAAYRSQSLRSTYITQPVTQCLKIKYVEDGIRAATKLDGVRLRLHGLYNEGGITYGDIFDWVQAAELHFRRPEGVVPEFINVHFRSIESMNPPPHLESESDSECEEWDSYSESRPAGWNTWQQGFERYARFGGSKLFSIGL